MSHDVLFDAPTTPTAPTTSNKPQTLTGVLLISDTSARNDETAQSIMGQCCVRPPDQFSEHDYDEDVGPRGPRHLQDAGLKDGDVLPRPASNNTAPAEKEPDGAAEAAGTTAE